MVLVDTSVWIRFLSNREPYARGLDDLLSRDEVVGHEMIFGELLVGERSGRAKLLSAYGQMHQAPTVPHAELIEFTRARRLHGRGLGWIDVHLLASAIVDHLELWTVDNQFAAAAAELGVRYVPRET